MQAVNDLFSLQAKSYAAFRPVYPSGLYEFLFSQVKCFDRAWDCGCGNGQVAGELIKKFGKVDATDISSAQLSHAVAIPGIEYTLCRAEQTAFEDDSFDLITVATALHWFDFDAFYREVRRVGKPGSLLAAWTYVPFKVNPEIDRICDHFSYVTVGDCWHPGRRYLDAGYSSIPFPFTELEAPQFKIEVDWTYRQFIGYVDSWSAVQEYKNRNGISPLQLLEATLPEVWPPDELRTVTFPLFMRLGIID